MEKVSSTRPSSEPKPEVGDLCTFTNSYGGYAVMGTFLIVIARYDLRCWCKHSKTSYTVGPYYTVTSLNGEPLPYVRSQDYPDGYDRGDYYNSTSWLYPYPNTAKNVYYTSLRIISRANR